MTTTVDIVNRALQVLGTRTTVTAGELAASSTNEAIQANLQLDLVRRRLIRMAPWNFALKTANLTYITSAPGTPENTMAPTTLWAPGQPAPPWGYEYQYPVDCLRAVLLIPSTQTGFAGGVPITTAVTGGAASFWQGPPVKFKVQNDTFVPVLTATVQSGGSGYVVGDILLGPGALVGPEELAPAQGVAPVGGPVQLQVTSAPGGVIADVSVLTQVIDANPVLGGSYFAPLPNPVATTGGTGSGATFNLTFGTAAPQRVILTNQEFAICSYCQEVTDPNLMDDGFQEAWAKALGAEVTVALTGDKKLANGAIQITNERIMEARSMDGNESLTINDVTPDWIRVRGIDIATPYSGPYTGYDWGGLYPIFG